MVSNEEIKEVSDKVLHVYNEIGLMVIIDETLCTNQYVVLKLKPMHGTRITWHNFSSKYCRKYDWNEVIDECYV